MTKKELKELANIYDNGLLKDLKAHEVAEILNQYESKPLELIAYSYALGKLRANKKSK